MTDSDDLKYVFGIIALAIAILALFVGAVLPQASDVAVDLGLGDLNDVDVSGVAVNQTVVWNGSGWVSGSFSNLSAGWDDLNFPALSLARSAALSPNQAKIFASGSVEGLLFDGATKVNEVFGAGEILHSYKQGSDLYPHVHWLASTVDVGNVTWFLEYDIVNVNGVYSSPVTVNVTQATTGAAWVHRLAEFPSINGTGLTIGSQIAFRLYRNATASTDTYGADAALLSFGIHYQMDSVGSSERSNK